MRRFLLAFVAAASLETFADRTLNREAASRLYAPLSVVGRVETLERESVTLGTFLPSTASVAGETTSVTARPFATTTLRSAVIRGEDDAMSAEVFPAQSRNYDIFLPDDAKTRSLLPISLGVRIPGAEVYCPSNAVTALPAYVRIREPSPGLVLVTTETVR